MIKFFQILVLGFTVLFSNSCSTPHQGHRGPSGIGPKQPTMEERERKMAEDGSRVLFMQPRIEDWAKNSLAAYKGIAKKAGKKGGLTGTTSKEKRQMHRGATVYVREFRQPFVALIADDRLENYTNSWGTSGYQLISLKRVGVEITTKAPSEIKSLRGTSRSKFKDTFFTKNYKSGLNSIDYKYMKNPKLFKPRDKKIINRKLVRINPTDELGQLLFLELKIELASAIKLYETYKLALRPYFQDHSLRYSLLEEMSDQFSDVSKAMKRDFERFESEYYITKLIRALDMYRKAHTHQGKSLLKENLSELGRKIDKTIVDSFTYKYELKNRGSLYFGNAISSKKIKTKNFFETLANNITYGASKGFGNAVGSVSCRPGAMTRLRKKKHQKEYNQLISSLKPLDMLLEKTPFRFTDTFIPGHYGHVAIWVGNEKELRDLDFWTDDIIHIDKPIQDQALRNFMKEDSPAKRYLDGIGVIEKDNSLRFGKNGKKRLSLLDIEERERKSISKLRKAGAIDWITYANVTQYLTFNYKTHLHGTKHKKSLSFKELIRSGHQIIEALRPGIGLNHMHHFLDIDDFASLRLKKCGEGDFKNIDFDSKDNDPNKTRCYTKRDMHNSLKIAFLEIGKPYDFNFDVNTIDLIVCSELAYQAYPDFDDWDHSKSLGKMESISPDQAAFMGDGKPGKSGREDPFYPAVIYFNAKRVDEKKHDLSEIFNLLLETKYSDVIRRVNGAKPYADGTSKNPLCKLKTYLDHLGEKK